MNIPDKIEAYYLIEMIESSLLCYKQLESWADQIIQSKELPPAWICDISITKYQPSLCKIVRDYVCESEIILRPPDLDKFHVGCLWLRYLRREISWATLLNISGQYLDCAGTNWGCEIPYNYLNIVEDNNFTPEIEQQTKLAYLNEINIKPFILMAFEKYKKYLPKKAAQQVDAPEPATMIFSAWLNHNGRPGDL